MARSRKQRQRVSARKRAETHRSGLQSTSLDFPEGVQLFKLDSDKTRRIDIIPYVVGSGNPEADKGEWHYERTYFVHYGVGPDNDKYVCLAKTLKKPCPICEHRAELTRDPDADEKEIKELAPKERQLFNVIDADNKEDGVQLWEMSYHLFGKLLDKAVRDADEDEDFEYFSDPETGFTLKLGVEEKSIGSNNFYEVKTIMFKNRAEQYDDDIVKESYCLDELVKIEPYEKVKAAFLQIEMEEDDQEEEKSKKEEKPKTRKPETKKEEKSEPEPEKDEGDFSPGDVLNHSKYGEVTIKKVSPDGTKAIVADEDGDQLRVLTKDLEAPSKGTESDDDDWGEDESPTEGDGESSDGDAPFDDSSDSSDDDDDDWS